MDVSKADTHISHISFLERSCCLRFVIEARYLELSVVKERAFESNEGVANEGVGGNAISNSLLNMCSELLNIGYCQYIIWELLSSPVPLLFHLLTRRWRVVEYQFSFLLLWKCLFRLDTSNTHMSIFSCPPEAVELSDSCSALVFESTWIRYWGGAFLRLFLPALLRDCSLDISGGLTYSTVSSSMLLAEAMDLVSLSVRQCRSDECGGRSDQGTDIQTERNCSTSTRFS